MFPLFMKKLATDTSSEEIRRTTTVLEQNNIKYVVLTKRSRGNIGSAYDAQSYAKANIAMYKAAPQPIFVYFVYVKPKQYDQAKKLIEG
jgi:hypothetical protein